jgi:hypothetical protein
LGEGKVVAGVAAGAHVFLKIECLLQQHWESAGHVTSEAELDEQVMEGCFSSRRGTAQEHPG